MTADQLEKEITARRYRSVYILTGEEAYFIDRISNLIASTVLSDEEKEFNQSVVYGLETTAKAIESEARRFPLLAPYHVVIVREAQLAENLEDLTSYIQKPVPSTILVLCYKKKADKRKKFFKAGGESVAVLESNPLREYQVPEWITSYVSSKGFRISQANAVIITENLGTELSKIANEFEKVFRNIEKGKEIGPAEIEAYIGISREYNPFELNSALGSGNYKKAARIIRHFSRNEKKYPIIVIITTLFTYFTKILKLHYYPGKSSNELAALLGINQFFVKEYQAAARRYSRTKLIRIIKMLHDSDLKSKGIRSHGGDNGELMKEMLYGIMH